MSVFMALVLIVPYLFFYYCLMRLIFVTLMSCSGFIEILGASLLSMFFTFIMTIAGYMLISSSYLSIKNNQ